MNILYMDCFSGISGNMTIGAFLDLGVEEKFLLAELKKLNVDGYKIETSKKFKNGIESTYFNVILCDCVHEHAHTDDDNHLQEGECSHSHENNKRHYLHKHRNLKDVEKLIDESELSDRIKELSKKMFSFVAVAEAKIHGITIDEVHFHEVGAIDSIIDIVGTAICIDSLNIEKVVVSKLQVGTGFVKCQRGLIPIPAPATLEIIKNKNIPVYSKGVQGELVTPTGAAIVAALADEFGNQPEMQIEKIGYGAGYEDFEIPNVVRLIIGKKN